MEEDFITLTEAAQRAGYRSTSALRRAVRSGTLRTRRVSARVQLTTPTWLSDYLATVRPGKPGKGYHRGQPRSGQDTKDEGGE